jgi:hypothetical protein
MLSRKNILFLFVCIFVFTFALYFKFNNSRNDIKKTTFTKLEKIKKRKKNEIIEYFNEIQGRALDIKNDNIMFDYFVKKKNDSRENRELEYEIDKHFVNMYGNFYDILFVDSSGYVFHSIKKESDFHNNLFEDNLSFSKLSERLKEHRDEDFVEYEMYTPSDEPAAFFIVSLHNNDKHLGWFILQSSINNINKILSDREKLGRSGEVYIVNTDKLMLNESRFSEDSTILKLKIDTNAIKEALKNNSGERIIEDYRGIIVFSSFEKFDVFGTSWIIIAEIDESEVISDYYKSHKNVLRKQIVNYLSETGHTKQNGVISEDMVTRVDMNEYAKAEPGKAVKTSGISTCTGVAILLKDKFGYLAHIPPTDEIYLSNKLTKWFLANNRSDFLSEIIYKMMYYDIYPYELKNLQFVIIQPHGISFGKVVDKIMEHGVDLTNIKYALNPDAISADVVLDVDDNSVSIEWFESQGSFAEYDRDLEDLGTLVKRIIKYNN